MIFHFICFLVFFILYMSISRSKVFKHFYMMVRMFTFQREAIGSLKFGLKLNFVVEVYAPIIPS